MIELAETEFVETAWVEHASGPGWSNTLLNVLVFDRQTCQRRVEAIQQADIPPVLTPLLGVAAEVARVLVREVSRGAVRS